MALELLLETNNFEEWLIRINEIIQALGASNDLTDQLLQALTEAIERGQASEYLGNPSTTIEIPNGTDTPTIVDGSTIWSWNWNDYVKNGLYWIPWNAQKTLNPPLGKQKDGMCWVASGGANGPTVQLAVIMDATPIIAVRYGPVGTNGPAWPKSGNVYTWVEIPNRKYLDTNFLNKTTSTAQTVKAPVKLLSTLEVAGDATFDEDATVKKRLVLQGMNQSIVIQGDDAANGNGAGESSMTMEVAPTTTLIPSTSYNLPLWNTATGQEMPEWGRTKYVEPFWIDKEKRTANINGTAEYANFVVPTNMVSDFNSSRIQPEQLYLPATAKAVKDLYDWTRKEFLPLAGGVLKGVVRHEQDIFLDHLLGIPENRTAAIRSVVRPLQLQCQGSAHIVSNSKQACLYLEKEDADSKEYTTEHHDATFIFRKVVLDKELCLQSDPNFHVLNSDPELDGYWHCMAEHGEFKVFANGYWEYVADAQKLHSLGVDERMQTSIFYRVVNAIDETPIASRCQYDVIFKSGDPETKAGDLSINDLHYQIAITDTDWLNYPITVRSRLGAGSKLSDGTLIAKGSILNGIEFNDEWTVNGLQMSYGMKEENDNGEVTETKALLTPGSIIAKGSEIIADSVINRRRYPKREIVNSDIQVVEDSTIAKGSILKSGSVLGLNSVVNGFQYTEPETIAGEEITEESILLPGSAIMLGSLISTASALNGIPGKSGYYEVVQGANPSELDGTLTNGSSILKGSILAPGSVVNEVEYNAPTTVNATIYVNGTAKVAHGTKLAVGSWIEEGSILNGLQWANGMKAYGMDAVIPLSKEDIAPIFYARTYDNIHGRWEGEWQKHTYRDVFSTVETFDAELWKNWIMSQIDALEVEQEFKDEVLYDLNLSLSDSSREWNYPVHQNLDDLLVNGKYLADIANFSAPDHVFETRCYVASHSRSIGVERLTVQPYKVLLDESGARTGETPLHDPAVIFNEGTSIKAYFSGEAFEYFNFNVVRGYGAEYVISFDTRLIPEQKNLNQKKLLEAVRFRAYSDDINASGEEIASFEKTVSLNVDEMMGAPFVFGARTRTGITSTGQLGDPLYDLGCVEINEDTLALRLRKKSVTMQSEIKETTSLVFARLVDPDDQTYFPKGTMQKGEGYVFCPTVRNAVDLGTATFRFRNIYLAGDPIVSSDQSLKTEIADFPESLMKKWSKVKWTSFKFKDAVEAKGKKARIHAGVVAQDVQKALRGMDVSKWSFFCKDKWNDMKEYEWIDVPAGKDEFGVWRPAHTERRIATTEKAGEQYSIRYQEMQCIENAYLRREIELLKNEIELLKQKIK